MNKRIEKVFHSADYDLRSLDRDWGIHVHNLYDTSIAAAFIGLSRLGLRNVVGKVLGVELLKNKRLQRADWGRRPLTSDALEYAAGDVRHLLKLRDELKKCLHQLGRTDWVIEECYRLSGVRYVAPDLKRAFFSIKGNHILDENGLAVLKSLQLFREREAIRLGLPHFKVLSDEVLIKLAKTPSVSLDCYKELGVYSKPPLNLSLDQALQAGLAGAPVKRPPIKRMVNKNSAIHLGTQAKKRLHALKEWRSRLGKQIDLDPAILWPTASLIRLSKNQQSLVDELAFPEVRNWQSRQFTTSLRNFLNLPIERNRIVARR